MNTRNDPADPQQTVSQKMMSAHPLEMFAYFRRFPQSLPRDIVYTFIWSSLFGVVFLAISVVVTGRMPGIVSIGRSLFFANCIGYTIHLIFVLAESSVGPWFSRRGMWATVAFHALVTAVGVVVGMSVAQLILGISVIPALSNPGWIMSVGLTSTLVALGMSSVFLLRERSARAEAAAERDRVRMASIEREAMVATLKSLQAQIEPHFLFNTLANIAGLIDADSAKAKRMLESFIGFLRGSLAATRSERTTLADDFALVGSYLDVIAVRMGDRLRYRLQLPATLRTVALPPLLLQPLVENAIRHGIEPKVEGGLITLAAREQDGRIFVEIADTGVGFGHGSSAGIGLANVRERLRLQYGREGKLTIREHDPAGTVVSIEFPAPAPV